VNLQGAKLTGDLKGVTVTSGVLCPRAASPGVPAATEPCIDAKGPTPPAADGSNKTLFDGKPVILTARNGLSQINVCNTIAVVPGGNPNLNKDPSPPYPATVFGVVGNLGPDCQPPDEPLEIN
jgi:hypothetical protein